MADTIKLPVGVEDFSEIRETGFFYIDKTRLIEQLLEQYSKVRLYTRPRRFGKSLNMSMLKYFFEIGSDSSMFEGLYISANRSLCEKHMGKYPVISVTLKDISSLDFTGAKKMMAHIIGREAERFSFLAESPNLTPADRARYKALTAIRRGMFSMDYQVLELSLQILSELLYKHFGRKVIILIDEYDVPLDKAYINGYYDEMVSLIRNMFSLCLKTNPSLEFAVLTGCLRVSKESIFTGLNNFTVMSITDTRSDDQFGFTESEVMSMLAQYGLEEHLPEIRKWYDGYRFGNAEVYCPWDVVSYVSRLLYDHNAEPEAYWINTSGNSLLKLFVGKADKATGNEIEKLVAGESVEKQLRMDLTYDEIDTSPDNLWSVLFTTGYLTLASAPCRDTFRLKIPNEEIRYVFRVQIRELFSETVMKNTDFLTGLWKSFEGGNAEETEKRLNTIMADSISVFDVREKENSYHMLLLGLLAGNGNWIVRSNREAGDGFADLVVETDDPDAGLVIELKYSERVSGLDKAAEAAIEQIHSRNYDDILLEMGRCKIRNYGIAFSGKRCRVISEAYPSPDSVQ